MITIRALSRGEELEVSDVFRLPNGDEHTVAEVRRVPLKGVYYRADAVNGKWFHESRVRVYTRSEATK